MSKIRFIITPTGNVRCLVGQLPVDMRTKLGDVVSTKRCSHVDTWNDLSKYAQCVLYAHSRVPEGAYAPVDPHCAWLNKWWADMTPVRGPVLGPFEERQDALDAEIEYLYEHHLPEPRNADAAECTNRVRTGTGWPKRVG